MKKIIALMLMASALPTHAYWGEAGVILGSGNLDTDSAADDSDYSRQILSLEFYFEDVEADAVLAEQAFVAKASGIDLTMSETDFKDFNLEPELESASVAVRGVINDKFVVGLASDSTEIDAYNLESDSRVISFGAYLTDYSALVGRLGSVESEDTGFELEQDLMGINYEHYAPYGQEGQAIKFEVDLEVLGGEDDFNRDVVESTFTIGATFYFNQSFGIGIQSEGYAIDDEIDECSSSSYLVYADWFVVDQLRLSAGLSSSVSECDIDPAEPVDGALLFGVAGRF